MRAIRNAVGTCLALFAAQSLAQFSPPSQVTVVTDGNFPPYLFRDAEGNTQGIVKDKWELWSLKTGVSVKLEGMEWARAQRSVVEGRADVIDLLFHTEARAQQYEFSPDGGMLEGRVFFHRSVSGIRDAASMRGFTVGTVEGNSCINWLEAHGVEGVRAYPDSDAVVRAAGTGEIRLFCLPTQVAQYFLLKQGKSEEFRQTAPLYSGDLRWAVARGRTGLRDFVQAGFERISAEELEAIDERWLGNPLTLPIHARYYYYAASVVAALLAAAALLALWSRTLRRRVTARTLELSDQKRVLELIAHGAPLQLSLDALLRNIEKDADGMLCSILLLDEDGLHLRHASAPSLPAEYCRAIDGVEIGPSVGSCGTAAFRRAQVVVEDIQRDPLWADFRVLAQAHGLQACWSTPILDPQGRVLGTFALYFRAPTRPAKEHFRLIATATDTAAIAIIKARGERERELLVHALGERVKELAVLHAVAQLVGGERAVDRALLTELVLLLPPGWQFPEICVARVSYDGIAAQSLGWRNTAWRQSARFTNGEGRSGMIEVAYLEERPAQAEGPFLAEERKLIDSLAELVGDHFERVRIQSALRRSEDEMRLHAERLRALSRRLMQVEEAERRNINRELHDRIAQNLSALQLNLGTLRMELGDRAQQAAIARIDDAQTLLEATSNEVRDVMAELRPATLDDFGLLAALREHAAVAAARFGIEISVTGVEPAPRLAPAVEIALFRIAQEALGNVAKHARARHVQVRLEAGPQSAYLSICDDGMGFDAARPLRRAAHYGIATMRERAEAVGASLRIEATPGAGTRVEVAFMPAAAAAAAAA